MITSLPYYNMELVTADNGFIKQVQIIPLWFYIFTALEKAFSTQMSRDWQCQTLDYQNLKLQHLYRL